MADELSVHIDHDHNKAIAIKSESDGSRMVVRIATIKPDGAQMTESEKLITSHGNQAYWEAIRLATIAVHLNDEKGAAIYGEAARELLKRDYNKFPRESA